MLKTYKLHVDTGSLQTTGGGQGGSAQNFVTKTNGNPFQCQVLLGNRHRTFQMTALKNAQIPIGFYNVRAPYNTITMNGVVYTMTPGNYSSTTYLAALNAATSSAGAMSALGTWSFISATNQTQFLSSSGSVTITFPTGLTYPTLATLLGFVPQTTPTTSVGTSFVSTYSYILNFDHYISIWIENLGTSSLEPAQITYKLPVNVASGSILHWAENTQNEQVICVTDSAARVDRLNITVLDRYGQPLNNNGLDWSFTLEVKSDN
jgi:hypothetical protein